MAPACEACRNLKMRCSRSALAEEPVNTSEPCDRCKHHGRPCKIPPSRPGGRKPGSRGRYKGVEKALRKIQTELRKAKHPSSSDQDNLRELLGFADGDQELIDLILSQNRSISDIQSQSDGYLETTSPSRSPNDTIQSPPEQNGSVSNPLGLVADVCGNLNLDPPSPSNMPLVEAESRPSFLATSAGESEPQNFARHLLRRPGYVSLGLKLNRQTLEDGLDALLTREVGICRYSDYFKPSDMTKDRDIGPDLDPVELGLASMEEAHYLFPLFFARLHPINGILDPILHTPEFVQSRSALLFTWIMAISAQFDHASGSIAKRLRIHGEHLSKHVYASGYKSVEIVQGYYISLLSAVPANTMVEERSWLYTIYAFGVAAELGLDREARAPGCSSDIAGSHTLPQASPGPDGSSDDRENNSQIGDPSFVKDPTDTERLARNRERTWLRILLWERAHSAARGRVSAFPETDLTLNIETWYCHPLADLNDKYTCAFILLRRHLGGLQDQLKRQIGFQHPSRHWVLDLIDSTLQPWCRSWLGSTEPLVTPSERVSNAFLRFVYMHGRLWTLSFALHGHAEDSNPNIDAIKEDCFESAVNCCEMAVHALQEIGEPIYCMLAPTWAMMAYSAVLALRLFPLLYGKQSGNEVELLSLLSQVALQLEKAGTTPSHRFGIAALLGQHLFKILRARANFLVRGAQSTIQSQAGSAALAGTTNLHLEHLVSGSIEDDSNQMVNQSQQLDFDPFISRFDPFLTLPFHHVNEDGFGEGFTDVLWDWVGQGFGNLT
ncbi:hypothetical protein PV08_02706 [Exophiala spinifera]|uniref:Zn(2)-C6 fungal-type domain-containing protein n=1 Tax=Exophiala spinifera TaxID=91928 RepID=A0A0D2BHI1_9EURO|nr:uncharacterized protein PV08_02706 [Exophiala spinifera]KIW18418.1 hypothetical protein PV08_02706 [Exophiala spinifera]